jgi:A/G-specific adenine glycosylase
MLQQTTVRAVERRYDAFLRRFPDLSTLARAREESVLAAWSGLGYYARARNLWRAARQVMREHRGVIPREPEVLRRLPGFGEYMAAAVASLAFGAPVPAAEANVTRVIARLRALRAPAGSTRLRRGVLAAAAQLLPRREPGRLLAAMMDLGQTVCTPRRPDCRRCPLSEDCAGYQRGEPERFPVRRPRAPALSVALAAAYVARNGRALLERRSEKLLEGLWEFPSAAGGSPGLARRRLRERLRRAGIALDSSRPVARAAHTVVNRRLAIEVFRTSVHPYRASRLKPLQAWRWFRPAELSRAAIPTLTRKIGLAAGFLSRETGVS